MVGQGTGSPSAHPVLLDRRKLPVHRRTRGRDRPPVRGSTGRHVGDIRTPATATPVDGRRRRHGYPAHRTSTPARPFRRVRRRGLTSEGRSTAMGYAEKVGDYWRGRYRLQSGKPATVKDSAGAVVHLRTKLEAERAAN